MEWDMDIGSESAHKVDPGPSQPRFEPATRGSRVQVLYPLGYQTTLTNVNLLVSDFLPSTTQGDDGAAVAIAGTAGMAACYHRYGQQDSILLSELKASQLGQELGTQTAFAMTSRWLWLKTGSVHDVEYLDVKNITMNNMAVVECCQAGRTCKSESVLQSRVRTLLWTQFGRRWTTAKHNFMALRDWCLREKLSASNNSSYSSKDTGVSELLDDVLFPNVKYGFNGRHLRIITKEWLSYIKSRTKNGTKMWSGLLIDLLEKVDIGLGATDVIYRRSLLMDFSYPVVYSPTAMVYKKPPPNGGWWVLFNPLSTHLLAAVGGSLVAVTFCICILETSAVKLVPDVQDGPMSLKRAVEVFGTVFFVTGGAALLKPTEVLLQSRPARMLLLSWWMVTLVVAAAYSGTLTAFLSVAKQPQLFSSPRDLVSKQHNYQWGSSSNDTTLRQIWDGIQRFAATDPDVISNDVNVLTTKVRKGNFVIFQTELFAFQNFGEDCDVETVDANIKLGMAAIVFPKGSALTKPVSNM
ncbi:glutamate receptor 3-like [Littorina saxatilis]|uniref:glutamate receptor 3-like n=1 Tax=Littorina saxatilis TaxID=31220 RepID=UPI0038B68F79